MSSRSNKIIVVVGVLVILLLAVGGTLFLGGTDPIDVTVHQVGKGTVEATLTNTRSGLIEACQRARLSTITDGRIEYLAVREGDRVKKGQVLMRLWAGDLVASQGVASARVESSRQGALQLCALAEQANKEDVRQEELVRSNFLSPNAAEKFHAEAVSSNAACDRARSEVQTASRQHDSIHTNFTRTVITAPFDGTVAKINGEVGEIATPSPTGIAMPPAIDLIDDSCLYVRAPMDEIDAPRLTLGLPVRVRIEAVKNKTFAGSLKRISPYVTAAAKQARTVDVDVEFVDMDDARRLLVGYSADVEIILSVNNNTLRVPTAALRDGEKVWVVNKGIVEERRIKAGLANMEQTEVLEGLKEGDFVITSLAVPGLEPGAAARPVMTSREQASPL